MTKNRTAAETEKYRQDIDQQQKKRLKKWLGAFKEEATMCALSGIGLDERDRINRKGVHLLGSRNQDASMGQLKETGN